MDRELAGQVLQKLKERGIEPGKVVDQIKDFDDEKKAQFFLGAAERLGLSPPVEEAPQPQSAKERYEAGDPDATLIRDEYDTAAQQTRTAVRGAGETVLLGQAEKLSAGVRAAGQEVGEFLGLFDDNEKGFKETYRELYKQEKTRTKELKDTNPKSWAAGNMGGWLALGQIKLLKDSLGASGQALKSGKYIKGALYGSADVALKEVGEAAINIADRVMQVSQESNLKPSQVITEELVDAAYETVGAAVFGGVAGGALASKTIKNSFKNVVAKPVRKYMEVAAEGLGDSAREVIKGMDKLAKKGVSKASDAQNLLDDVYGKSVEVVKKLKGQLKEQVGGEVAEQLPAVRELTNQMQGTLDLFTARIVDSVQKKAPKGVAAAFGELGENFKAFKGNLSTSFGHSVSELYEDAANVTLNIKPVVDELKDALTQEGTMLNGKAMGQFKETIKMLDNMGNLESVSFQKAHGLLQFLGELTYKTKSDLPGLEATWGRLRGQLSDPNVVGEAVARPYDVLSKEYQMGLKALKGVRRGVDDVFRISRSVKSDELVMSNVEEMARTVNRLGKNVSALEGMERLGKVLDPEQVKTFNVVLDGIKETVELKKASKASTVRKNLLSYLGGKEDGIPSKVLDSIEDFVAVRESGAFLNEFQGYSQIKKALSNPLGTQGKANVDKALKWTQENSPQSLPSLKKALNKAATYHRLVDKEFKGNNAMDILRNVIDDPEQLITMDMSVSLNKQINELVSDEKLLKAYIKENPNIFRTVRDPQSSDNEILAAIAAVTGGPQTAALVYAAIGVFNLAKNPQNLYNFAKKAGVDLSERRAAATAQTIVNAQRAVRAYLGEREETP